jgi:hypothetical protein
MPKVEVQDDAKARETREYPNKPRQSSDQGQTDRHAQATPDSCQHFENHPLLRRINDRGNCGQSAARVHFNEWTPKGGSSLWWLEISTLSTLCRAQVYCRAGC